MFRAASILSMSALAISVLAYTTTHYAFPRVGFEGGLLLGGLLLWVSALCVVLTWGLCLSLFIRRCRAQLLWPLSFATIAAAVLVLASGLPR
jgi:hypothetical protein